MINIHDVQKKIRIPEEMLYCMLKTGSIPYDIKSNFPLKYAADFEYLKVLKLLLDRKPSPYSPALSETLVVATSVGNLNSVKMLVEYGVDPSLDNNRCLLLAVTGPHISLVAYLLSFPQVDPSLNQQIAVNIAAAYGFTDVLYLLLQDSRVNVALNSHLALNIAFYHGHYDTVDLLLQNVTNHEVKVNFQFLMCVADNDLNCVKLLLEDPSTDPSCYGNYAFKNSCSMGYVGIFKEIMECRTVKDSLTDEHLQACLEDTVFFDRVEIAKIVLDYDPRLPESILQMNKSTEMDKLFANVLRK
jgi:hypothetical protein